MAVRNFPNQAADCPVPRVKGRGTLITRPAICDLGTRQQARFPGVRQRFAKSVLEVQIQPAIRASRVTRNHLFRGCVTRAGRPIHDSVPRPRLSSGRAKQVATGPALG